jgi:hypothetical protein
MDPVLGIMLDVIRIVTFQPNVANTQTRRIARERELGSTDAVEYAPAATHVTKREQVRRSGWFRFSFTPR